MRDDPSPLCVYVPGGAPDKPWLLPLRFCGQVSARCEMKVAIVFPVCGRMATRGGESRTCERRGSSSRGVETRYELGK